MPQHNFKGELVGLAGESCRKSRSQTKAKGACLTFRNSFDSIEEKPSLTTAQGAGRDITASFSLSQILATRKGFPGLTPIFIIKMCSCFCTEDSFDFVYKLPFSQSPNRASLASRWKENNSDLGLVMNGWVKVAATRESLVSAGQFCLLCQWQRGSQPCLLPANFFLRLCLCDLALASICSSVLGLYENEQSTTRCWRLLHWFLCALRDSICADRRGRGREGRQFRTGASQGIQGQRFKFTDSVRACMS